MKKNTLLGVTIFFAALTSAKAGYLEEIEKAKALATTISDIAGNTLYQCTIARADHTYTGAKLRTQAEAELSVKSECVRSENQYRCERSAITCQKIASLQTQNPDRYDGRDQHHGGDQHHNRNQDRQNQPAAPVIIVQQPTILVPQAPIRQLQVLESYVNKNFAHAEVLNVRKQIVPLQKGHFVNTLSIEANALQPGAYLEIIIDGTVINKLNLSRDRNRADISIKKRNGIDYNTFAIRSIGASNISKISVSIGEDADLVLPPAPPAPPLVPTYPPVISNPTSLNGYCSDFDHQQFTQAKDFAYDGNGLNMTSQAAVNWGLNYNQNHACGTISEYKARFNILKNFAYDGSGLNLTSPDAISYALGKVETVTVIEAEKMARTLKAIKNFAYDGSGLNLTSSDASSLARQWIDRGYCEDSSGVQNIAVQYQKEYNFAYSGSGLNYSSQASKAYALSHIRNMSRCGDLLK
jgi:hypothetical protein